MNSCITILLEHLPMLAILSAYAGAGFILQSVLDQDGMIHLEWCYDLYGQLNYFILGYTVLFFSFQVLAKLRPRDGFAGLTRISKEIRERYWKWENVGGFLVVYAAIPPFLSIYSSLKQAIPIIYPFSWDEFFMKMDFFLHAGHHPWKLIQVFAGYPTITRIMDLVYTSWHAVLFTGILWQAWSSRRRIRAQFFISLLLLFIIGGTILATLFSSAGPCYYSAVAGSGNPYQSQILYLASIHETNILHSVEGQKLLWWFHTEGIKMPYIGISAMPSIHVGVAVLFAILGWRANRILGFGFTAYAILIQLGSIHLGWHYAVDGYFGAILAGMIWKGSGRMAKRAVAEKQIGTTCGQWKIDIAANEPERLLPSSFG